MRLHLSRRVLGGLVALQLLAATVSGATPARGLAGDGCRHDRVAQAQPAGTHQHPREVAAPLSGAALDDAAPACVHCPTGICPMAAGCGAGAFMVVTSALAAPAMLGSGVFSPWVLAAISRSSPPPTPPPTALL